MKRKKKWQPWVYILLGLVVLALLVVLLPVILHNNNLSSLYRENYELAPLGVAFAADGLHMDRVAEIVPLSADSGMAQGISISEEYSITNSGADADVVLVYPVLGDENNGFSMTVDGVPCETWSGAFGALYRSQEQQRGVYDARLRDGSYWKLAFPDSLETLRHENHNHIEGAGEDTGMYLRYYIHPVHLEAGETVTVIIEYPMPFLHRLNLVQTVFDIPCDSFLLRIHQANQFRVSSQNVTQGGFSGDLVECKLAPEDAEQYYIELFP